MSVGSPTALNYNKGGILMDKNSLAHTTWECKYHIKCWVYIDLRHIIA